MKARQKHDNALTELERLIERLELGRQDHTDAYRLINRCEESFTELEDAIESVRDSIEEV